MYDPTVNFITPYSILVIVLVGIMTVGFVDLFSNNNLVIGLQLFLNKVRTLKDRIFSGLKDAED